MSTANMPDMETLRKKYLQQAQGIPGAIAEIDMIASGRLAAYAAQHPMAKAFGAEAAQWGHKPTAAPVTTQVPAANVEAARAAAGMNGSPQPIQQIPVEQAQHQLSLRRRVGETDEQFKARLQSNPNATLVEAEEAFEQPMIPRKDVQARNPNAPKPQSFRAQQREEQQRSADPIPVPDISSTLVLTRPDESFRALQARGTKHGEIIQTNDGAAFRMGHREAIPQVFVEDLGQWQDRDKFVRNAALSNEQIRMDLSRIDDAASKIDDDSRFTKEQQDDIRRQVNDRMETLARRVARGLIPDQTMQDQFDDQNSPNFVRTTDGGVWHKGQDGKLTQMVKPKHERQPDMAQFANVRKIAQENVIARIMAETDAKQKAAQARGDKTIIEDRQPTSEEIKAEMDSIMAEYKAFIQGDGEQAAGGEQPSQAAPAQPSQPLTDFDARRMPVPLTDGELSSLQSAVNPKTGQTIYYRNLQWVDANGNPV